MPRSESAWTLEGSQVVFEGLLEETGKAQSKRHCEEGKLAPVRRPGCQAKYLTKPEDAAVPTVGTRKRCSGGIERKGSRP